MSEGHVMSEGLADSLADRFRWMFWGWGTVGLVYVSSHYLQGKGHAVPVSWLDEQIAYDSRAVWMYLSFFVLIPLSYLRSEISQIKLLARQMQCGALLCGAIYMLYPTSIPSSALNVGMGLDMSFDKGSIHDLMMQLVVFLDSTQNCLPSLHALLSVLAVQALSYQRHAALKCFYMVWLLCILVSILMLKRHLMLDVLAGMIIAVVLIGFSQFVQSGASKHFFGFSMK